MIGDVNFFLYPYEDGNDDDDGNQAKGTEPSGSAPEEYVGEVDIMIADAKDRGKGTGRAVVSAFLYYVLHNADGILKEYSTGDGKPAPKLKMLMAKIKQDNSKSIALFKSIGFKQEGDVNYFREVKFVFRDLETLSATIPEGYMELVYQRPQDDEP